ncbi:MAG: HEAT repeat domain-containing protein [Acidobacteria bacterium]|nr:HEAT repeat domain-containing protein [Acidobacteriota bacterium]
MNFLPALLAFLLLALPQEVYTPSEFVRVSGDSLKARFDAAVSEGRRGAAGAFWVAYQFPLRSGVRLNTRDWNVNIDRGRYADGIEWIYSAAAAPRAGLFLLLRKSDGGVEKSRILNLNEDFRIHDRKVYWIGEPDAQDSLALIGALAAANQKSSSLLMTAGLHPAPYAAESLLRIARTSASIQVRKDAVFWLGQEVSRQAGEELEKMARDAPEVEVQKQAVFALSRRNSDEAVSSLMRIAREHPNAAVRKQAVFWLGQKRDPKVLDLFEQMLKK